MVKIIHDVLQMYVYDVHYILGNSLIFMIGIIWDMYHNSYKLVLVGVWDMHAVGCIS